jgi:hypothetical protein
VDDALDALDGDLALVEAAGDALGEALDLVLLAEAHVLVVEARQQVLLGQVVEVAHLGGDVGEDGGDLVLRVEPARREQVHLDDGVAGGVIVEGGGGDEAAALLGGGGGLGEGIWEGLWGGEAGFLGGVVGVGLAVGDEAGGLASVWLGDWSCLQVGTVAPHPDGSHWEGGLGGRRAAGQRWTEAHEDDGREAVVLARTGRREGLSLVPCT